MRVSDVVKGELKDKLWKADHEFLIKSDKLEKLRPLFDKAADSIKEALHQRRPIIIRHHDDADGYTSGFVTERAILSLVSDEKKYFLTRTSSRSPYYEYSDALRDLNNFLAFRREGEKAPLVLLLDLGSNRQSMKAIDRLSDYGFEFIIIDHHPFDEENRKKSLVFLNPHVEGAGSDLNAGALCTELALFLNDNLTDLKHLPALSGVADKSSGNDLDSYIKISGFSKEALDTWARVIDHETFYLRFPERKEILADLFMPTEANRKIVGHLSKTIEQEMLPVRKAAEKFMKQVKYLGFTLIRLDKNIVGWDYASTKLPRIASDLISGNRVVFIETDETIIYRADYQKFNGIHLIEELRKNFPYAQIDGGGHTQAGAIRFSPASKEMIVEFILDYLAKLS